MTHHDRIILSIALWSAAWLVLGLGVAYVFGGFAVMGRGE